MTFAKFCFRKITNFYFQYIFSVQIYFGIYYNGVARRETFGGWRRGLLPCWGRPIGFCLGGLRLGQVKTISGPSAAARTGQGAERRGQDRLGGRALRPEVHLAGIREISIPRRHPPKVTHQETPLELTIFKVNMPMTQPPKKSLRFSHGTL